MAESLGPIWIQVPPGRYRYVATGDYCVLIRMVRSDYRAAAVRWQERAAWSHGVASRDTSQPHTTLHGAMIPDGRPLLMLSGKAVVGSGGQSGEARDASRCPRRPGPPGRLRFYAITSCALQALDPSDEAVGDLSLPPGSVLHLP